MPEEILDTESCTICLYDTERQGQGMTRKALVKKAIQFMGPERVPVLFFNSDKEQSDILMIDVGLHFMNEDKNLSEWGFKWKRVDGTMGQPEKEILTSWDLLDGLKAPEVNNSLRFFNVGKDLDKYGKDKYLLANLELTGFTVMALVRGFENIVVDLLAEPDKVQKLADIVFEFEIELIKSVYEQGFDGVAFFDDWGTQTSLIISPQMWREMFKERYRKQFDYVHKLGMDVYFHTCGYVYPIIDDLIEIGVDMLNISQPNLYDIKKLGKDFGGKVCFVCPVSYQTTSITGSRNDVFAAVEEFVDNLGVYEGGLIGYIEEYSSIGMSRNNYQSCIDAFKELGDYRNRRKTLTSRRE